MVTMKERLVKAVDKLVPIQHPNTEAVERMKKMQEEQKKTAEEIKQEQGK